MVRRHAFTMIELIFAIVLIALVVVGVPEMISRNDRTLTGSLVQEELFIAAKTASELLTQPWDINSPDNTTSRAYTKVLDINSTTNTSLNRLTDGSGNFLPLRVGQISEDNHRRFHNDFTYPGGYQIPNDTEQPVLPANTQLLISSGYSGDTDSTFFSTSPVQNNAQSSWRAAKMATITVTDTVDTNRTVTLRIFMANIGEYAYAHRRF